MEKLVISSEIDKVSDGLARLGYYLPRHASSIKSLLVRLDRVANQADKDLKKLSRKTAGLGEVEEELERNGFDFSVQPGSGITGTVYSVYKGQMDPRHEVQKLKEIAEKHGGKLDPSGKSDYKLYIVSQHHNVR